MSHFNYVERLGIRYIVFDPKGEDADFVSGVLFGLKLAKELLESTVGDDYAIEVLGEAIEIAESPDDPQPEEEEADLIEDADGSFGNEPDGYGDNGDC